MTSKFAWFCVAMTILFTIYGQIVARWRMRNLILPDAATRKALAVLQILPTPWMLSVLVAAFLASLFWLAAMTKLPLTTAYPFMSLPFIIIAILSAAVLDEPLGPVRILGIILVIIGLMAVARG